jgi:hypothetical protein
VPEFITVETEDGSTLRFKCAGPSRTIERVPYETEDGTAGMWRVTASSGEPASCVLVDDSSDGVAWLISGAEGVLLVHEESGARVREPYLLLSRTTELP